MLPIGQADKDQAPWACDEGSVSPWLPHEVGTSVGTASRFKKNRDCRHAASCQRPHSWWVVRAGTRRRMSFQTLQTWRPHFSTAGPPGQDSWVQIFNLRQPWWLSGLALPAAQGVILETLDRVPLRALWGEPASPSACVLASLSVSL